MIITHNYYIDFFKAFNQFLKKILDPRALKDGRGIQKIEYSIASKTLLSHKLYGNESFEYPNLIIDLQDIHADEGVSTIKNNAYGLIDNINTVYLADNLDKNQFIKAEMKKYILNFNITINLEESADMLNFYHLITNHVPVNFTFVDFSFFYGIDITEFVNDGNWDFDNDNIFNVFKQPDPTERDKEYYYSYLKTQPELELTGISKNEDKEGMKYSIQMNFLASFLIPSYIYGTNFINIERIVLQIDTTDKDDYPIITDTENIFSTNKIKKGSFLDPNSFILNEENESFDIILKNEASDEETLNSLKQFNYILKLEPDLLEIFSQKTPHKTEKRLNLYLENFEIVSEEDKTILRITKESQKTHFSLLEDFFINYINYIKNEESESSQFYNFQLFYAEK